MTISTTRPAAAGDEDSRRARILEGGLKVFLAYGFSRTTMDDIARAAELSRPMLYLQFRNKADIFRAIGARFVARSLSQARAGLDRQAPFAALLMEVLDRALFGPLNKLDGSPHGEELLDVESKIAADIIVEWRQGLTATVETLIADEAARTGADLARHDLSPRVLAEFLLDGIEGMRHRGVRGRPGVEGGRRLVAALELVLRAAVAEPG